MRFKRGDTVQSKVVPEAKFFIIDVVQVQTGLGVTTDYRLRQYYPEGSPGWPGLHPDIIQLNEVEVEKAK